MAKKLKKLTRERLIGVFAKAEETRDDRRRRKELVQRLAAALIRERRYF